MAKSYASPTAEQAPTTGASGATQGHTQSRGNAFAQQQLASRRQGSAPMEQWDESYKKQLQYYLAKGFSNEIARKNALIAVKKENGAPAAYLPPDERESGTLQFILQPKLDLPSSAPTRSASTSGRTPMSTSRRSGRSSRGCPPATRRRTSRRSFTRSSSTGSARIRREHPSGTSGSQRRSGSSGTTGANGLHLVAEPRVR